MGAENEGEGAFDNRGVNTNTYSLLYSIYYKGNSRAEIKGFPFLRREAVNIEHKRAEGLPGGKTATQYIVLQKQALNFLKFHSEYNTGRPEKVNSVEPIRDRKKLAEILEGLERDKTEHGKRLYLLFATLYYTGLRVCDVIKLQKKHVMGMYLITTEQKTGKVQRLLLPQDLRDIYDIRLADLGDDDYLFKSRKRRPDGTDRHITTRDAGYDMKIVKERFSLNFPFACHSLRKTHGYMRYKWEGDTIETLRQHFNHSTEAVTRRYIGIDEEERNKKLANLSAGGYKPPKPERRTQRKGKDGVALEIERFDREENGRKWGLSARAEMERAEAKKKKQELEKAKRSERDRKRYQEQIKPKREAEKAAREAEKAAQENKKG